MDAFSLSLQMSGAVLAATLVAAAACDLRSRTIPNLLPVLAAVAFVPAAWAVGLSFEAVALHAAAAIIAFALAALLFALGAWGGGDAKLAAAVVLWTGFAAAPRFVAVMAVAGGVLALAVLLLQGRRAKVPYGIAIALAGLDWWAGAVLSRGLS